jgi:spore cortex biosynthesis protein YabQ
MTPLNAQFSTLGLTVALGVVMGILFDFYRAIRSLRKWKKGWGHLADFAVWLVFTVMVFAVLLYSNWGEVGIHIFFGIGLGLLCYFRLASRKVLKLFRLSLGTILQGWAMLVKGLKFVLRVVFYPIFLLIKGLLFPVQFLARAASRTRAPAFGLCKRGARKIRSLFTRKKK